MRKIAIMAITLVASCLSAFGQEADSLTAAASFVGMPDKFLKHEVLGYWGCGFCFVKAVVLTDMGSNTRRGYIEVGSRGGMRPSKGSVVLVEGPERAHYSYIDLDEVDGIIKAVDKMLFDSKTIPALPYVDVLYKTGDGFQFGLLYEPPDVPAFAKRKNRPKWSVIGRHCKYITNTLTRSDYDAEELLSKFADSLGKARAEIEANLASLD